MPLLGRTQPLEPGLQDIPMEEKMSHWIGWIATTVFAASYFCKHPATLRWVQGTAAALWIGYGVIIHAPPVILANIIVAALAGYSALREDRGQSGHESAASQGTSIENGEAPVRSGPP